MQIEEIYSIYKNHPVISIDNRKIEAGCIFVAIRGEKFDGNRFALPALEAGAAFAIIDNQEFYIDERTILVDNALLTLQQLANYHRKSFSIPFIAIGGSNGKTTTKELTWAVLSTTHKTFATKGNLNNHIGVPLTLLSIPADTQIAIIEIGANHLQETYDLCKIAEPTYGVVTNNGKDHLEGFGSIENVIEANSELFRWLKETDGTAFVNADHADLMRASVGIERWTYGKEVDTDFPYQIIPNEKFAAIRMSEAGGELKSQLFGDFNCDNIAAAAAIGTFFKVGKEQISKAISEYMPGMNRSQIIVTNDMIFYVDCYNANPSSMQLALNSFASSAKGPTGVILGDMLELGSYSLEEHTHIIEQLKALKFDKIILVGKYFGQVKDQVHSTHFDTTEEAAIWFKKQDFSGWSFLLKGSRGYALERLINF